MTSRPRRLRPLCATVLLLSLAAPARSAPAVAALPPGVHRVLFLGDSITYGGGYAVYVETYFLSRHPGRSVRFFNAGLSSETVSGLSEPNHAGGAFPRPDLHERLARVLERLQPNLVFACYGMNDGIYQPLDEGRFAAFRTGLARLRAAVHRAGAALIHATPPIYVDVKGDAPAYAAVLDRYSEWLVAQRAAGWDVADLHTPMARELAARRTADPRFTFARDGVHPGDEGHWIMAREILRHLGATDLPPGSGVDALLAVPPAEQLLPLVRARMELWRDAWLTATGHTRPRIKVGLPLEEAGRRAQELDGRIADLLRR
jgi:lysophospholipase L1-like esterase